MNFISVAGNGVVKLDAAKGKGGAKITAFAPAAIGTAVITLGYYDETGTFVPLANGGLVQDGQVSVDGGKDFQLLASVATFSVAFDIGVSAGG